MNPIDQNKVNIFLAALNQSTPNRWVEIQGTNALVRLDISEDRIATFQGNSGFPVKGFIDTVTGEIKLITARRFTRD